MTDADWAALAIALGDRLAAGNHLDDAWRSAVTSVPRHLFVPGHSIAEAYSDHPIVTQTRSVALPGGDSLDLPTSSASAPAAVAVMLDRLDVSEGMRVLEIGTGTGYNAALLCCRLGDSSVYSVDIDPALVEQARAVLGRLGYRPLLAVTDGYQGLPAAAPYHRILATAAIGHVPPSWIRQLATGGRIVAPLLGGEDGALAVLTKTADDEVVGRIDASSVAFMPLRREVDNPLAPDHGIADAGTGMAHYGRTTLDPTTLRNAGSDLLLFVHLHISGASFGTAEGPDGLAVTVSSPDGHASAFVAPESGGTWTVHQRGRRLWDTVEHAVRLWDMLDRPARTRLGVTALDRVDRQFVWLDDPDGPYSWPMSL